MADPTRKIAELRALFEGDALAAWDVEDVFNDKLVQAIPALLDVAEAADKVSLLAAEYSATWSMLDDLKNANELLRKALARLADGQEKP